MSKENVISKKEPFARMVKRDHISVGKAWAKKNRNLGSRWIQNRQISQISHKIVIFLTENRRNRRTIWRD